MPTFVLCLNCHVQNLIMSLSSCRWQVQLNAYIISFNNTPEYQLTQNTRTPLNLGDSITSTSRGRWALGQPLFSQNIILKLLIAEKKNCNARKCSTKWKIHSSFNELAIYYFFEVWSFHSLTTGGHQSSAFSKCERSSTSGCQTGTYTCKNRLQAPHTHFLKMA